MVTEQNDVLKKDIYVELELRAIRNGVEWSRIPMKIPMQSEASYFIIEGVLNEAMKSLGVMAGQDVLMPGDSPKPPPGPPGK